VVWGFRRDWVEILPLIYLVFVVLPYLVTSNSLLEVTTNGNIYSVMFL
jgi:hypothetical protein